MRKRLLIASHKDRARRIRITKLTSSLRKRREADKNEPSKSAGRRSRTDKSIKTDEKEAKKVAQNLNL